MMGILPPNSALSPPFFLLIITRPIFPLLHNHKPNTVVGKDVKTEQVERKKSYYYSWYRQRPLTVIKFQYVNLTYKDDTFFLLCVLVVTNQRKQDNCLFEIGLFY